MLIYHRFPNLLAAASFADRVALELERRVAVTSWQADELDPFPFELAPPVVYVERDDGDDELEARLRDLCDGYGGTFAGT